MNPTAVPALSPAFDRARKLSRIMAALFTIGFWLALLAAVLLLGTPFVSLFRDGRADVGLNDIKVSLDGLSLGQRTLVMVAMEMAVLPVVLLTHHTSRVFRHFARGEVFTAASIAHMRQAGLWLIASFFAGIGTNILLRISGALPPGQIQSNTWPLFTGIATFIGAHVMAEAQRIAAEHAEII